MRAKRSKKYRKTMASYQMTFGFREPYQVLVDSRFLKTCHSFRMDLQKYLNNTLHGDSRLFVTRCTLEKIMADWEEKQKQAAKTAAANTQQRPRSNRGPGRPDFLPPPTEVPLRHCKHKNDDGEDVGAVSEEQCLLDLLAGQPHGNELAKNKQHYILATADADDKDRSRKGFWDVRDRARLIPGVPIVYVKRSVMILEEMSAVSERAKRKDEKDKFGEGLVGIGRKRKRGEDDEDESDGETNIGPKVRGMAKPKGPNPLSVRKKKSRVSAGPGHEQDGVVPQESKTKRTRRSTGRKKRSQDAGQPVDAQSDHRAAVAVAASGGS